MTTVRFRFPYGAFEHTASAKHIARLYGPAGASDYYLATLSGLDGSEQDRVLIRKDDLAKLLWPVGTSA